MHNLTYTERARNAYAVGNIELSDALEQLAEWEAEIERLTDRVEELEDDNDELRNRNKTTSSELYSIASRLED